MSEPRIMLLGTGDTKSDELTFMAGAITSAGGRPIMIDVSVLGDPPYHPDFDKHDIAAAAGCASIDEVIHSGDENSAMALMAAGASALCRRLCDDDKADGVIILGGSMGTDLALDVALALPLGFPKFVVSTISFSHLIPPERIATDLMMILWAGGLYGLNDICKASLAQACGAVVGAARAAFRPEPKRPLIGMTSLGSSCLKYMKTLKPALEARGYEVAIFHATGMGGRAFETIAANRGFAAVMDFCLQEVTDEQYGSSVTSGPDRLENAGRAGIPQIIAPGAIDMVDLASWRPLPANLTDRPYHAHNRLLGSITTDVDGRRETARLIAEKLKKANGPVAVILPLAGLQEWDQPGEGLHDPEGLAAFIDAFRALLPDGIPLHEVNGHINGPDFHAAALAVFDRWVADGIIPAGKP